AIYFGLTPVFLFFLTGVVKTSAIIIDRCDLTAILKENDLEGFAGTTIAEWICLVFHSSGFNTAALNEGPEASNHGIFLLSSRWWCNDSKMPYARNYCNLSCEGKKLHLYNNLEPEKCCTSTIHTWIAGHADTLVSDHTRVRCSTFLCKL
uniref:lysozyme n=1 Tax=Varanus komodoensis TaxID=61221 RepID=A0A8D2KWB6_VARKO